MVGALGEGEAEAPVAGGDLGGVHPRWREAEERGSGIRKSVEK